MKIFTLPGQLHKIATYPAVRRQKIVSKHVPTPRVRSFLWDMSPILMMCNNPCMSTPHTSEAHTSPDTPAWLNDDEQSLWRQWLLVTSRMDSVLARELQQQSTISYPDYAVLVLLSEHPDKRYRIAALADALDWDRSRLSHQITRMTKRGLVRRETCSNDGRGAFVAIEDAGLSIIAEAAPGHVNSVRRHMFDKLDTQDQADLRRILATLAEQFTEESPA